MPRTPASPLIGILCSGLALPAAAGPAPVPDAAGLAQVIVTAKGYAAKDSNTPIATLALSQEELAEKGAHNPGEALRGLPGLAVASDGPHGQNPVIRGLKKESVVLLVDGMRLNSAQPAGAVASFMSLGLAERVEVVKGPASVLYGTGALGGAINVLLPQARFVPGLGLRAAASYDSASQGVRATGVANYAGGDHALMLGYSGARLDDYRAPHGKVDLTGYDSDSLIGQYRYRVSRTEQLRLSLQKHSDRDVWYPGSAKPGTPAVLGTVTVRAPEQERTLAELAYTGNSAVLHKLHYELRAWRQEVRRSIQAYSSALGRPQSDTDVGFVTRGVDIKGSWLLRPEHWLSFGVNGWRMEASPARYLSNNAPLFTNRVRNDPFSKGRIDALGVYLQDDIQFDRLNILAAVRRDSVKGSAAAMNNGAVTSGLARRDHAVSASLAAILEVTPLLRPYANLGRAFRAGEMRERFESSPRGDGYYYLGNPAIRPEYATQAELGLKGENGDLDYRVAAYRTRVTDYITGRVTGATVAGLPVKQTENIGRVVLAGVELQGSWRFRPGHVASLAWSRLRADNRDLDEPLFQGPADELSIGWQGALGAGWTADASLRLVDRQDRIAQVFSRGTENATAGFATADLGASYRWGRQTLRILARNIADKAYHEHLAEGVSGREIQASGRSLMLSWQGEY